MLEQAPCNKASVDKLLSIESLEIGHPPNTNIPECNWVFLLRLMLNGLSTRRAEEALAAADLEGTIGSI